jgi:hypothetical protein
MNDGRGTIFAGCRHGSKVCQLTLSSEAREAGSAVHEEGGEQSSKNRAVSGPSHSQMRSSLRVSSGFDQARKRRQLEFLQLYLATPNHRRLPTPLPLPLAAKPCEKGDTEVEGGRPWRR